MHFEWDENKNALNIKNHGIDFETAKFIFAGPTLDVVDDRKDYGEERIIAIGVVDDLEVTVVYTWRGEARRLISARRAHDKERRAYHQAVAQLDQSG